jgi:hypothetical protein
MSTLENTMGIDRGGEVVTFFSFKGGTGRTMALANVAWILASQGKRVLVVDWDLDSPGLHKFFHPFLDADLYESTSGVVDIISDYARAATNATERPDGWHRQYARMLPRAVSLDWSFSGEGTLDIVSAGRAGRSYSAVLSGFNWDNFYHRLGGGLLFSAMRDDMKRTYDYTLIDSRTGLSDIAGICTVRFPDTVVNCFTLSGQSIEGAAGAARSIDDLVDDRKIRILPVPMRVEDGEQGKLENGRALARTRFTNYPGGLDRVARQRYWAEVEIPYKPFYAYEEILATFGDEPLAAQSLLSAFERLTSAITRGEIRELAPMRDDLRRRYASRFERRAQTTAPDVFLSYAPEDRLWADWIGSILRQAGAQVVAQGTGLLPGADVHTEVGRAVASASYTMVLLSAAYVRSSQARAVWEVLAAAESDRARRPLIPICVAEVRVPPPFDAWTAVDLARLDERAARDLVLSTLDLHPPAGDDTGEQPGVRFPGARPPAWQVPTRNASFTGRSALLERLRDNLAVGVSGCKPQAVHGLGGVGKTQLVIEFAHRFMAEYDLVWWVPAQQEDLVSASLAEIAPALKLPHRDNIDEAASAVREALRRGNPYSRWLIVFDNAEDPELLRKHLPQGTGHVIITSRNPAWSELATPLEVESFLREESVEHLVRRVPALEPDPAGEVAGLLGDLPLAVELASAWLETTGMSIGEYRAMLEDRLADWLSTSRPSGYPLSAAATWEVSIDRLRHESPAAVRLLELCSCFGPEPIAMRLLYGSETIKRLVPFDPALVERMMLGRVIRELGRYALARVDQRRSSIQVHRLVQAVIRDNLNREERYESTEHDVHRILLHGRPEQGEVEDPENWPAYNELWPHLGPCNARDCEDEPVRELLVRRVRYMWTRGEYADALALARRLEDLWTNARGPDDRMVLFLRYHIANILRSQGDYRAALATDRDVRARQMATSSPDHVHTLFTSGGLVADLSAIGNFTEALPLARETYDRLVHLFGEDHRYTLSAANNLAMALRLSGDCFTASDIDRKTYGYRLRVLGGTHPFTLFSAMNLARDLRDSGSFDESTQLLRSTLATYRERVGPEYPETLRAASSLSVSLRKAGRHEEAHQLSASNVEQYGLLYSPDHPDALACLLNLACDLSALDEAAEALGVSERTTSGYERLYGPDHQYTLVSANNLAIYLRGVGRLQDGLDVAERTLRRMRTVFGEKHPLTLGCSFNVANARADAGLVTQAEELEQRTWQDLTEVLGSNHPDTLFCAGNHAISLRALDRTRESQQLMQNSLTELERVLGAGHPHLDRLRHWRRINRDLEPQPI